MTSLTIRERLAKAAHWTVDLLTEWLRDRSHSWYRRVRQPFYWVIHRTVDRYDRIYIKSLPPGYHDKPEIILHGVMDLIVDYVENESNEPQLCESDTDPDLVAFWTELRQIYLWWKYIYPSHDLIHCSYEQEEIWAEEETEMLIRVMKIRGKLWT